MCGKDKYLGGRSLVFALFLSSTILAACGGVDVEDIGASIRDRIESEEPFAAGGPDSFRDEIRAFYEGREFEAAWVGSKRSRDSLRTVLTILCRSDRDGLAPGDYTNRDLEELISAAFQDASRDDSLHARDLARLDIAVTHALMDYASDLLKGRVDPHEFGTAWHAPINEIDLPRVLQGATSLDSLRGLSRRLSDVHDQYGRLRSALAKYRTIASEGGWPTVPPGESIAPGDSGARVNALIDRLAATGDLDTTASDSAGYYTLRVAEAVTSFQSRHGLEIDGVAGEGAIAAMNVPVEERIRQIELNLERWRWIPSEMGNRYLYVNIPAYELHAVEDGREVMSMAVVVGEVYEENATPVFSDTMEYIELNPYWNVPERIATEEILPKARRDRGYLARNNYEIVAGWESERAIDPRSADLDRVESGNYRIRQKPGPQNSLGQIKFMFPNQFNIYLHDTPADYLFARAERAYSHGCIRVEKPVELAKYVLSNGEWTEEKIQEAISSGQNQAVSLKNPLPVYILYWTAFVDSEGRIHFREDIYENDVALQAALERQASKSEAVPCDSLTAPIR